MTAEAQKFILYPDMPTIADNAVEAIRGRGEGIWEVDLKPYRKNKSQEQLGYFHGVVLKHIQDHLESTVGQGWSKDNLRDWFYGEFADEDVVVINGKPRVVMKTLSQMNTKEASDFITKVVQFAAAELDLFIPDPS